MKMRTSLFPVVLALAVLAPAAAGQASAAGEGPGWLAWIGCWRATGDGLTGSELVCVLPADDPASARFATIENGEVAGETVIRADGVARDVEEGGCAGTQSARFSADGRRIFTRSDLTCSNAPRISTGVLGFVGADRWVDAQALTVREQHAARTVRYEAVSPAGLPAEVTAALQAAPALAREAARLDAAAPVDVDGVIEASRNLAPPALEGFVAAGEQRFDLDAGALVRLAAEGVPSSSIDVMIALSYPERFAVREREEREPSAAQGVAMRNVFLQDYCFDPYWSSRFPECYGAFGLSSRYNRFGYSPWGYDYYGWRYSRDPVFVIVEPEGESGGSVVRGRGYTPGGSGESRPATRRGSSGSAETVRPSSGPRTSTGVSGSGRSGASSDGYAPRSGNSGSGRSARPRGSEE